MSEGNTLYRFDTTGQTVKAAAFLHAQLGPLCFRSTLKNKFAQKDFEGVVNMAEAHPTVVAQDMTLSKHALWSFGALNRMDELEILGRQIIDINPESTQVICYILSHQRKIYNSARFWDILKSLLIYQYRLDESPLSWNHIFATLKARADIRLARADADQLAYFFAGAHLQQTAPRTLAQQHFLGMEFYYFYEVLRMHDSFGKRFQKKAILQADGALFYENIVNLDDARQQIKKVTLAGPNVFVLMHCSFNTLVARFARAEMENTRFIGRSLHPPKEDDGFMLFFQSDKASRLAVFARAMKHLIGGGNVIISPDGIAGNDAGATSIFGIEIDIYAGAAALAREGRAPTYLLQPSFSEDGIYLDLVNLSADSFKLNRKDFIPYWRERLSAGLEGLMDRPSRVPSYCMRQRNAYDQ